MARHGKAGLLLVVALWLLAILSMTAIALSRFLSTEASLMRYQWARAQARAWAKSGVYLAMERLTHDGKEPGEDDEGLGGTGAAVGQRGFEVDPGAWAVRISAGQDHSGVLSGRITIRISDEERKPDLNTMTEAQLARFLNNPTAATAILNDRGAADGSHQGRRLHSLEELLGLPGVSAQPDVARRLMHETTVYTHGFVNINTVSAEALMAFTPDRGLVETLIKSRPGPDGRLGTDDDCKATALSTAAVELASCAPVDEARLVSLLRSSSFEVRSRVFTILASGEVDRPSVRYHIHAVVRRGGAAEALGNSIRISGERFAILSWREGA